MLLLLLLYTFVTLCVHNAASQIPDNETVHVDPMAVEDHPSNPMPSSRIINGFYLSKTNMKVPWIVSLQEHGQSFCTGSLVNEQYILTAAHCVAKEECKPGEIIFHVKKTPFQAVCGEYELNSVRKDSGTTHDVIEYWFHEEWQNHVCQEISVFDFAVLKLRNPIKSIVPVCLDDGNSQNNGKLYSFGYGRTKADQSQQDDNRSLKGIAVNEIPHGECHKFYGDNINDMICTKANGVVGSGICSGDSGGPLAVNLGSSYRLIGVHSYTHATKERCINEDPSASSRISRALDWITNKVGGNIKTC